ncbi:MAG: TonB family protein [Nitrospiraceae bacterium]
MAVPARSTHPVLSLALTSTAVAPPDSRTVGLSVLLHAGVVLLALIASWKSASERPLGAAVQVSLITLPPAPKTTEVKSQPTKAQPQPQPQKTETPPAPQPKVELPKPVTLPQPPAPQAAPKAAPAPAPAPPPMPLPPAPTMTAPKAVAPAPSALPPMPTSAAPERRNAPDNPLRGALKDLSLPHDAPRYGELASDKTLGKIPEPVSRPKPQPTQDRTRQDVDSLLSKLRVPDAQRVSPPPPPIEQPTRREQRPSLADDYQQELERELKRVQQTTPVQPQPREFSTSDVKTASSRPLPSPPAPTESKPTQTAKAVQTRPDTAIKVPGMGVGSNAYLGMVQRRISEYWQAPPVDLSAESLVVIVRFRLARSGAVSSVVVEQSSGNDYFDLAAKRAVLNADPLPPFPKELTDSYYDAHFSFVVGGQMG